MANRYKRLSLVDQGFLSLFITFSLIEFANRGSYITDGLFVSTFLGQTAIASVGVVKSISSVTGIVSGLLSVGMQGKCSYELGKGDIKGVNRIFSGMVYISIVVSVLCGFAFFVGARPIAVFMGASGRGAVLADGASEYLRGIALGFPSIVLSVVLSVACQLDSAKKRVRQSSFMNFFSNCLFDLIAVKLGLGVFGIGLATSLARYVQIGYLLVHFRSKYRMLAFTRFDISLGELREALTLGLERALRSLGKVISPLLVNRIVLLCGGTIAMTAFSIEKDLMNFTEIFATGLADAVALQATVYYGEVNKDAILEMGKSVHKVCAIFLGTTGLIFVLLSKQIAGLYISGHGEVFSLVRFAAIMTGLYAPLNGIAQSRISYLGAVKKIRNMQILTFLSSVVYIVISAFILGKTFGSYGVLGSDFMRAILLMLSVWIYYAVSLKKFLPAADDYLTLPESFDLNSGNVIDLNIRDMEDVSLAAEQIQLFCKGHKSNKEMKAALCFEELAVNTIKYGFPNCKTRPGINLRIIYSDEGLTMRLRDNCPMFDVEQYIAKKISDSDNGKGAGIGLKLIGSLAKDIKYVHSLENNNVIVQFF